MMGGSASGVYRAATIPRKLVWAGGFATSYTSVEQVYSEEASAADVLASAGEAKALSDLCTYTLRNSRDATSSQEVLLYLIEDADAPVCKIGITIDPGRRLNDLQVQTWRKLRLAAVFSAIKGKAETIEQAVLREAVKNGAVIRGEWLGLSPEDATGLILDVTRRNKKLLCGPDMWFDNLTARVVGLRKEQARQRAAA